MFIKKPLNNLTKTAKPSTYIFEKETKRRPEEKETEETSLFPKSKETSFEQNKT